MTEKPKREALGEAELEKTVEALEGWEVAGGKLCRTFEFKNFVDAFGFMTKVALTAEKMDHHPDWSNVYGRVDIRLWTHDLDAISTWDVELARAANAIHERK